MDEGFEIVAAAQDTGGEADAGPFYDRAQATFTCLIDVQHSVTSLYGMVNVPTAVWIDEKGRIVRPPEVAWSKQWKFGSIVAGDDRYADALRDWVRKGAASAYAFSRDELLKMLKVCNPERPRADAHLKIAVWLQQKGQRDAAALHWQTAQELAPDTWNYYRQDWNFEPKTASQKFRKKLVGRGSRPYYTPADLRPRR